MYLLKQVKIEKDALLVGRPKTEDLEILSQQGYQTVLDIMPMALKDKKLGQWVRTAGMQYTHIPVEVCNEESCKIEEEWVARFFRFISRHSQIPMIINTDDETLGISLVILANLFLEGKPYPEIIKAIETLGLSLKGRQEIKRFIRAFCNHYQKSLPGKRNSTPGGKDLHRQVRRDSRRK